MRTREIKEERMEDGNKGVIGNRGNTA